MEYDKNICPVLDVNGVLSTGKQFDLEINLPEDNRNVIYGVVKDCCGDPVCDAVVKLIEVVCDCGKEERRPVSHSFTNSEGQFVFGPLCPNRFYEIQIWFDHVKHCKICTKPEHTGKCLKGVKLDCKKDYCKPCKENKDCITENDCTEKDEKKNDNKCEEKCEKKLDRPYRPGFKPF